MDILLIGNGMYSTGRGTEEFGTILPAIVEYQRSSKINFNITVAGTNEEHSIAAKDKYNQLSQLTGVNLNISFYPNHVKTLPKSYLDIINSDNKPQCAIIVVPDNLHYEITKECLKAGIHCLVVKPLVLSTTEAIELTNLAEENGLYGAVEYHKRWDKSNLILKESVEKDIGELLYCIVEYSQRKSIPSKTFSQWSANTNVLNYLGIHYIDIMYFITKATPKRVMAIGQTNWLKKKQIDTPDSIQCIVEWINDNGGVFTQTLLLNWIDPETSTSMSDQKIKIIGTNGRIEADQKERGIRVNIDNSHLAQPNPDFCRPYKNMDGLYSWRGYGIESVVDFLSDVENIKSGLTNIEDLNNKRPTFRDSIAVTSVLEAANISLNNNGEWVDINI